jgi:hypothetical protein
MVLSFFHQQGEYKMWNPFRRRKPKTKKQRLAEALLQMMEKWANQK